MHKEQQGFGDSATAVLNTNAISADDMGVHGHYHVVCRDKAGNIKWEEEFPNLVVAVGKELLLNTLLRTSGTYTTVGPFLGLTNATLTPAATDTMTTLVGGGYEFTNYTVGGSPVRGTAVFAAASSTGTTPTNVTTSTATAITYTITGAGGTVYGCFLVTGAGAVSTQSSTAGTLYSEGNFATAKATTVGDTVSVTYSTTATS
jgi:energy-converting hydrogenase Eha subunit A